MSSLPPIEIDPRVFLRKHCTLPALPMLVHKVQEVLQSDNVDIQKVIRLISSDPSLSAQIFKIVNSAYYGLPREITKIQFAIAFLGLSEVYRLVLSLSVINTISIDDREELDTFWMHSYYTAMCAKYLSRKYEPQLSYEDLWSAAILHDIGKLVYLKFFPEHYREIRKHCRETGCLFSQAEQHLGLPESSYMGALLCEHWRLPVQVREACEFHTLRDLAEASPDTVSGAFRRMICLGNLLAVLSNNELSEDNKHIIAGSVSQALEITESDFLAIMGEVYDLKIEVDRFMSSFSM